MYLKDYSWAWELVEKNRQILNQKLHEEIRKTSNLLMWFLYNKLSNPEINKTKEFIETLKLQWAKATRIKRREFHYKHLDSIQQTILKILKQFFDETYPEIASDPSIWWLYFNYELKDLVRFDFIFWYQAHNPLTYEDVKTYTDKFFLSWWYKQSEKKDEQIEDKKINKKHHIWLAKWHKLLNKDNYDEHKEILHKSIENSVKYYCEKFWIQISETNNLKNLLEKYFIYIIKNALLNSHLTLELLSTKSNKDIKHFIEDSRHYLEKLIWQELNIDPKNIIRKFFKNTNNLDIYPIEFSYNNTLQEDILSWESYFDDVYFNRQNTSSRKIYWKIMEEFSAQADLIKKTHALYSPSYFADKDKKEKLEADLYILNNCEETSVSLQNIIDCKKEELFDIMTRMDKHFYSKIDWTTDKWKWDSMEEITQKYMKYYKIPIQYRRNFFIIINYLNHYYKMKSDLKTKADEHNKKLEELLLNNSNSTNIIMYFLREYITKKIIDQKFQQKWDNYRNSKIIWLKTNFSKETPKKQEKKEEIQLSINF